MIWKRGLLATTALVSTLVCGAQALADDSAQVETVTVTAERRAEKIQQVPMQVTAFSDQQLAAANVKNTQDILDLVPNVNMARSYTYLNSFVTIRGVSEINNADTPVSVVVDGVPQNDQKQTVMDLFDVQQVEVLKGPQGGLYGRNAIGGAIIINTETPTNTFAGTADVSYGNGDAYDLMGSVSGPIVDDKLLFRASANFAGAGGLIKNTYLGQTVDDVNHDDSGRVRFLAYPTSWLTLDVRANYNDFRAGAIWDSVVASGNPNDIEPPISDFRGSTDGHTADETFKFDADLGFATLTGITGRTDLVEDNRGTLDFTNPIVNPGGFLGILGPVGQGQNRYVGLTSQELRLVSPDDQPIRWIAGAYYLHKDLDLLTRAYFEFPGAPDQFDNPAARLIDIAGHTINSAVAVYGQVDYDITKALTIEGAFRYDSDYVELGGLAAGPESKTYSSPQPKATLTYHFDEDRLVYATYSTGFRSGGFNDVPGGPSIPEYNSETLTNYEAGFKTSWLNDRLVVNGAGFLAYDHNYQFFFVDAKTASQIIANLPKVHISGVELEVQAAVTDELHLFGGLGTTDTNQRENLNLPGLVCNCVGNYTPKTIPWSLKMGFEYDRPLTHDVNGTLRFDYTHNAREYWQIDNADVQNPVDLINARAGVEFGRWGLYVWGRNLTDARYYEDYNPSKFSGLPYDIGSLAEPRTYGVEAKVTF